MSNFIKIKWCEDTGPCDVPCDVYNANGLHIDIDNGESGANHVLHSLFLCEKHAENLAKKILKALKPPSSL